MMTHTASQVVGVSEAARLLGTSADTVRRLVDRGHLPMLPSPYGRTFNRADVEKLARERAGDRTDAA